MADENIDALVKAVVATGKSLERGEAIYANLNTTVRKMKVTLWVAIVGLLADLALSIAFGFLFNNQSNTNAQVVANQDAIHKSECDLNGLFISADTPDARNRAPDKAKYDAQFHIIYLTRVSLGCQPPIAEPVRPPS